MTVGTELFKTEGELLVPASISLATADCLLEAENLWGPERANLPTAAEHAHWDWAKKAPVVIPQLAFDVFVLRSEGAIQGLMVVQKAGHGAKLDPDKGKPIIYINFLEAAPWNLAYTGPPRFKGCGFRLFMTALSLSVDEGFGGRVGLHSLKQAEPFYSNVCKMTRVGEDEKKLCYFELTKSQADALARGE